MANKELDKLRIDLQELEIVLKENAGLPWTRLFADDSWSSAEFFTAPASSRTEFHSCFAGGLLHHTMNVRRNMLRMDGALGTKLPRASLDLVAMAHDIGKIGTSADAYYRQVPAADDWRRRRGELYEVDRELGRSTVPRLSLYLLQSVGAQLTLDEHRAIMCLDSKGERPDFGEPTLGLLLLWADRLAVEQEKENVPPLPAA